MLNWLIQEAQDSASAPATDRAKGPGQRKRPAIQPLTPVPTEEETGYFYNAIEYYSKLIA